MNRLRSTPKGWLMAITVAAFLLAALVALLSPPARVLAAEIVVSEPCMLVDAILAANTDTAVGGCPAGQGTDSLILEPDTLYNVTQESPEDGNWLPLVSSTLTISGNGATIRPAGPAGGICAPLLRVNPQGNLTLDDVTLQDACSAIAVEQGKLMVQNSRILSNTGPANVVGGIENFGGTVSVLNSRIANNRGITAGGIYNLSEGQLTIRNSAIVDNDSGNAGGIVNINGYANIEDSQISRNLGTGRSAIVSSGNMTITASQITHNNCRSNSFNSGIESSGELTIRDSDISHNQGCESTVALQGQATIENSRIYSNSSSGITGNIGWQAAVSTTIVISRSLIAGNNGAGLDAPGGQVLVQDSQIRNNMGRGIISSAHSEQELSQMTVRNSRISSNTGGGIQNSGTNLLVQDTRVVGNRTQDSGGGVAHLSAGDVVLQRATITSNTAAVHGGGIYQTGTDGTLTVTDSLLFSNEADEQGGLLYQQGGSATLEQNCITGNSDTAIFYAGGDAVAAPSNWWGTMNGPGGAGPGSGDSVSASVVYTPFLQNCPLLTTLTITKSVVGQVPETAWQFSGSGEIGDFSLPPGGGHKTFTVTAGPVQITETVQSGYRVDVACTGDMPVNSNTVTVTLTPDVHLGCVFTNTHSIASMSVTKEASAASLRVGEVITYTYIITNSGDVDLANITALDDQLGNIPLSKAALVPGEESRGTAAYVLQPDDLLGPLTNQVIISATSASGTPVTGTATATVEVLPALATITVTKTVVGQVPETAWQFSGSGEIGDFSLPASGGHATFTVTTGLVQITETIQSDYRVETACGGDAPLESHTIAVTLTPNVYLGCIFTNTLLTGSVSGTVYVDANQNDTVDLDEGIQGVTVTLTSTLQMAVAAQAAYSATTTTDASGHFLFTDVLPGEYRLHMLLPPGYVAVTERTVSIAPGESVEIAPITVQPEATDTDLFLPAIRR